jgi:serine/threonine protein kinase
VSKEPPPAEGAGERVLDAAMSIMVDVDVDVDIGTHVGSAGDDDEPVEETRFSVMPLPEAAFRDGKPDAPKAPEGHEPSLQGLASSPPRPSVVPTLRPAVPRPSARPSAPPSAASEHGTSRPPAAGPLFRASSVPEAPRSAAQPAGSSLPSFVDADDVDDVTGAVSRENATVVRSSLASLSELAEAGATSDAGTRGGPEVSFPTPLIPPPPSESPSGAPPGTRLRLENEGLPRLDGRSPSEPPPEMTVVSPPAAFVVGSRIAEKYVVTEIIGRGGMGQVVAAKHTELGTTVAIKAVLPEALGDHATIARFKREALAMARLRSEHAVRILDVGEEFGMPYIMMEYLEGNDLASELRRRGALPIREAVRYVLEAIDVLAEAHDIGIVHRDLKPANLFLARRPSGSRSVRVLDFGIAKPMIGAPMPTEDDLAGRAPGKLTMAGMTLGTPNFMAPEQVSSGSIGPHTDIWGMGATLYTLLTASFPFTGPTVSLICGAVCSLPPIRPRDKRPEIPEALELIILKCLEKSPKKRFLSIRELAVALGHVTNMAPPPTTMGLRMPPVRESEDNMRAAEQDDVEPTGAKGARRTSPIPAPRSGRRASDPSLGASAARRPSVGSVSDAAIVSEARSRKLKPVLVVVAIVLAGAITVALSGR